MKHPRIICLLAGLLCLTACSRREPEPEGRNVQLAAHYYALAKEALAKDDRPTATKHLRDSLRFDEFHGPAHNDLGVIALDEDRLYDAAQHFEMARKLMPGDPRPRRNLAVALNRGGKYQEAVVACRAALEVQSDDVASMQTLAWLQVRHHLTDEQTPDLLKTLVQRGETAEWRDWAKQQQMKLEGQTDQGGPARSP